MEAAVTRIRDTAEIAVASAIREASQAALAIQASQEDHSIRPYPKPDTNQFSVMTFNLNHYSLIDREDSGILQPKPKLEAASIIEVIRAVAPDILLVQEMGDPAAWAEFKYALRQAGLEYIAEEFLQRGRQNLNLALLSRFPIISRDSHISDSYTIGTAKFPILRGVLDVLIEVQPDYHLRVMGVHLKSKVFHSFGQTEMRRAESRLVGGYVRDVLNKDPNANLVLLGDFNDDPGSLPIREVSTYRRQPILHDLRPVDYAGDAWTHISAKDTYHRIDYVFVSPGLLPEVDITKTFAVRSPLLEQATDHRPLVATFYMVDRPAMAAPDLTARRPIIGLEHD